MGGCIEKLKPTNFLYFCLSKRLTNQLTNTFYVKCLSNNWLILSGVDEVKSHFKYANTILCVFELLACVESAWSQQMEYE